MVAFKQEVDAISTILIISLDSFLAEGQTWKFLRGGNLHMYNYIHACILYIYAMLICHFIRSTDPLA